MPGKFKEETVGSSWRENLQQLDTVGSAVGSDITNIQFILGPVLVSVVSGVGVTVTGYYAPFLIPSSVVSVIETGLVMNFKPTTGHDHWIRYQLWSASASVWDSNNLSHRGANRPPSDRDSHWNRRGNVFANQLKVDLTRDVPDLDPDVLIGSGATSIQQLVFAKDLPAVKNAYSHSLTMAFLVASIMASLMLLGSVAVQSKNIKKRPLEPKGDLQPSATSSGDTKKEVV
ncbi:major facilitator superfamily transporter [Penicillium antarcticum]|uniref:major facilitator superfamily transporter n=1 Tax=Penicillium antarcticum TaxID=416450 RepID=UPI0023856568|nr:major facilitator superfamily transporter [Penicillium antarcticum]KAJ5301346.1 major facilitator superfamily transporter [Penicillium antarcticum]